MTLIASLFAMTFYLAATLLLGRQLFMAESEGPTVTGKQLFLVLSFFALMGHVIVLYNNIYISSGLNLGFFNALSLMTWGIALFVFLAALKKPLENLAIIIFPVTIVALVLEILFQSSRILPDTAPNGLRLHVLLSVCAYSLLTIAFLQAILLALQDRQITRKHPASIMRLPPMKVMQDLLIQIIILGFFMLSLSLVTGLMFLHDIFSQHLVHKTVLSIVAWVFFGILLWGHWTRGWRGKIITRWTATGFVLLLLAYFGSKFVLEVLLDRV